LPSAASTVRNDPERENRASSAVVRAGLMTLGAVLLTVFGLLCLRRRR
jgi:hypothetical protein